MHKGLKRFYTEDSTKPYRPIPWTSCGKGTWSLSVTRNRRLTFCIDTADREICDVNLEDYH